MLTECRAGFFRWSRIDLQQDTVVVDLAAQRDKGRISSIGGRTDAPAEFIESRKRFGESQKVELKADQLKMTIILTTDNFGGTQVQPRFPAVIRVLALGADSADTGHRFKECRCLMDEDVQPVGTPLTVASFPSMLFELFEKVLNQQM